MLAASSDRRSTAVCMPGNRQMRGGGNAGEIVRGGVAKRGVRRPKSFVSTLGVSQGSFPRVCQVGARVGLWQPGGRR